MSKLLPYDPHRRCGICGTLFNPREWREAYVGQMFGMEMHLVVHQDCFCNVHEKKPLDRAFIAGLNIGGGL